ncbi:hypothetical protein [Kitasatospora sp. NPDC056181]|uniref:hypothetical protein n=1 Tax=Kitasatospora sp. NPDC056181 TaxID=3345737 RepID=UPI0035E04AB5
MARRDGGGQAFQQALDAVLLVEFEGFLVGGAFGEEPGEGGAQLGEVAAAGAE